MLVALTREGVAIDSQPLTAERFRPDNSGVGVLCPTALMLVYNVGKGIGRIKYRTMTHVVLDELDCFRQWSCIIHIMPIHYTIHIRMSNRIFINRLKGFKPRGHSLLNVTAVTEEEVLASTCPINLLNAEYLDSVSSVKVQRKTPTLAGVERFPPLMGVSRIRRV